MKNLIIKGSAAAIAALLTLHVQAQTAADWENPAVLGINKLPYHATLQLPSREKECQEIVSLDGQWLFHWSRNPEERPKDFWREDYDVSQWNKITVPGNWQTQGYGTPIYININYPFVKDRPKVTTEPPRDWTAYENRNPVGSYARFLDVTKEMLSQNLILHFGGVHSAFYVWVNGQRVGYSQNSMSPAEFDVTKYLREGRNKLAVEVYRWSDGSYLEDQDMWRLSGIFRSVQLWVRPLVHISDYRVTAVPNADYSEAAVRGTVFVCNTGKKAAKELEEAASIDGCSVPGRFLHIMMPLTRSSMVSLGIFTAVFAFKDLMWPMIVCTNASTTTLSAGLAKMQGQYGSEYPTMMAAATLAVLPMVIIYVIFQKQFVEGIATSGGKL